MLGWWLISTVFVPVLGGATSKIGDPSDKDKERPLLEEKQIENYQEKIKLQLERILIKSKKIGKVDFSPLEQFYSDSAELLKKIYEKLHVRSRTQAVLKYLGK